MDFESIFSDFGIEIIRRENLYFLRYDSGGIVVRMEEIEIFEDDVVRAKQSEQSAYDVILRIRDPNKLKRQ